MDTLQKELRDLIKKTCDVLVTQPIPARAWSRVKKDRDLMLPDSAESRVNWEPFAYLLIKPLSLSPILKEIICALQNIPEIANKIVIHVDEEEEFLIYSGHMAIWLWRTAIVPYLDASFRRFQQIIFDQQLFESTFDQFIAHVRQIEPRTVRYITGLVNLKVLTEIDLNEGITVRPVTLNEIETWLNDSQTNLMSTGSLFSVQCAIDHTYHYLMEKSDVERHLDAFMTNEKVKKQLVNLLRLVTNEAVAAVFTEQHGESVLLLNDNITTSPNPQIFSHLPRWMSPLEGEKSTLLVKLWKIMDPSSGLSSLNLAFTRWSGAFERTREEDKLIDCWIGLESLFAPDSSQEVKFRSALRLAAFLGETPQQRKEIYDDARLSYDWRSAIVHGNEEQLRKLKRKLPLSEISAKTRKYLRNAILRIAVSEESFDPTAIENGLLAASATGTQDQ